MGESRNRRMLAVLGVASMVVLSACGTQVGAGGGGPTVAVTTEQFGSCPEELPEVPSSDGQGAGFWWLDGAPIGEFEPDAVVLCEPLTRESGGRWQTYGMVEKRYETGIADLVAALRLPDVEPTGSEVFCTTELPIMDTFVLVAADGTSIMPRTPQDECEKPRGEVWAALEALRASTPDDTTTYETEPTPGDDVLERAEDAQAAGCPDVSKNIAVIDAAEGARGDAPQALGGTKVRLCLMTPEGGVPQEPLMAFVGGGKLTDDQAQAIDNALATAKPGLEPCDAEPTESVIVSAKGSSGVLFAELGGCLRMSTGAFVGTVSPELLEVLTAYAEQVRPKK